LGIGSNKLITRYKDNQVAAFLRRARKTIYL